MRSHVAQSNGRPVPTRNLHVTLAFLGEVPEARVDQVKQCARSVATDGGFDLQFDQIEIWARARVLCLTPEHTPDVLQRLFERLRLNLLNEQFEIRHEEYRPHVTLARDVRRRNERTAVEPIGWRVDEFVLVQSQRGSAGSEYAIIDRWPLES